MKILIHDYAEHPFPFQLSCQLVREGHEIYHVYSKYFDSPNHGNIKDDISMDMLHVLSINVNKPYSKTKFFQRRRIEIEYGKLLSAKIKELHPDIVICSTTPIDPSIIVQNTCQQLNIKFIFWLQDIYSIAIKNVLSKKVPLLGRVIGMFYEYKEKKLLFRSDHIVSISEDFLPVLDRWRINKNNITVINNWAPITDIPVLKKQNDWAKLHEVENKFCFIYSGTLGFKHNPSIFIELARFFQDRNDVRIIIIAQGEVANWLREQAEKENLNNFLFLDYQPFESMPMVYASAEVLLAVLEKDAGLYSVPSKVLMYLCAQKPLLLAVPKGNLASRIVEQNSVGFCVEPKNIKDYLLRANELYNDENLRDKMAKNARKYAEANFDIEKISFKFIEIFNTLIK